MKKDFVNTCNNPDKILLTVYSKIEEIKIDGKIYDRNEDGDFDITSNSNICILEREKYI